MSQFGKHCHAIMDIRSFFRKRQAGEDSDPTEESSAKMQKGEFRGSPIFRYKLSLKLSTKTDIIFHFCKKGGPAVVVRDYFSRTTAVVKTKPTVCTVAIIINKINVISVRINDKKRIVYLVF